MFGKHVNRLLPEYCGGRLPEAESERVRAHLLSCPRCRAAMTEIQIASAALESLPRESAAASLWDRIEVALDSPAFVPPPNLDRKGRAFWRPSWKVAVPLSVILVMGITGLRLRHSRIQASWKVANLAGSPQIGSGRIASSGGLKTGEWLETDAHSRARISVASLGHVEVEPNTRIGRVGVLKNDYRLSLTRGTVHATIKAPPRLFFVETPSAIAVDLGCAYTLHVDRRGRSLLSVTAGWVAFDRSGVESLVPAGATCETRPGHGPGVPYFEDASPEFQRALSQFDFDSGGSSALNRVIRAARRPDTLTLWHLLSRVEREDRRHVYDRLAHYFPPPPGVMRSGILDLDPRMLTLWKDHLEAYWVIPHGFNGFGFGLPLGADSTEGSLPSP